MSLIFSLPLTETFKVKLTAATCPLGCVFQIRGLVILLKSLLLLPLRIGSATVPSMLLAVLAKSIHLICLCQSQLSRVNLVCAMTNVLLIVASKIVLLSLIILRTSAVMSTLAIMRLRSTIKAATIIFLFILAVPRSLVFNGRVGILHTHVSLWDGKLALLCTTLSA